MAFVSQSIYIILASSSLLVGYFEYFEEASQKRSKLQKFHISLEMLSSRVTCLYPRAIYMHQIMKNLFHIKPKCEVF